jgi:hypothetical protein
MNTITLTVILNRADQAGFVHYLDDVYDPHSPNFRHFLSQAEIARRFGPTANTYDAVLRYLLQNGFILAQGSPNRLTLTVRGTRADAERAFHVRLIDYSLDGRTFYAPTTDPALPAAIAEAVKAVSGLSSLARPASPIDQKEQFVRNVCPGVPGTVDFSTVMGSNGGLGYLSLILGFLLKAQLEALLKYTLLPYAAVCVGLNAGLNIHQTVYGSCPTCGSVDNSLALTPSGVQSQKIGLLEFDTFRLSDVIDWLALLQADPSFASRLSTVPVNGGVSQPGPGESEVLLDIAAAMVADPSPNTQYVVYSAPGNTSFATLFNAMINDGDTVIANSWSQCEDQTSLAEADSIDSVLAQAAASGISVFNGAGDSGSTCLDGSANTIGVPADSPHATAVGGTTPTFGPGYTYGRERWWDGSNQVPAGGQGGFGVSRFFSRPVYQNGLTGSTMRSIPDIAVVADPQAGLQICQADAGGCPTGLLFGGTSMAAPLMAGLVAFLNEKVGFNIGEANPVFYGLVGTNAFRSAASMGSDFAHVGLGSPNLDYLRMALSKQTVGPVSPASSLVLSSGVAPVPADGSTVGLVQVNLFDANGYPVSGKTVTLVPNQGSHTVVSLLDGASDVQTGAVVFQVTDTTVENVTFHAEDITDGVPLSQTATLSFVASPATSAAITAFPASVPANGQSSATVTVTLRDSLGRPTPGKLITLAQGSGHSILTGPSPAVTDANGQIQFTATDNAAEIVAYTAIDVTDGNLPVPGSADVTYVGGNTSCVGAFPTAASGFTLTAFASGFVAESVSFSGINISVCPGAQLPAFDASGSAYVADFPTGTLYKFTSNGGAASSGNVLASLGEGTEPATVAPDGSLYIAHLATGGNPHTGNILQVDPSTGAVIRMLASGLTCPSVLAVDPLSHDLFFDDGCSGAGTDNPAIWRISNPASATPTITVYATLPGTPGGALSFAPDGTLYASYGAGNIARIGGTNTGGSPTVTTVPGITTDFWLTVAEAQANGAAKSLVVHPGTTLELVDITTNPSTVTPLANGQFLDGGRIGPDGCLYVSGHDTIYKIAPSSGGCGFLAPISSVPAVTLTPTTAAGAQGAAQSVTASVTNVGQPQGLPIIFTVGGANAAVKLLRADGNGRATFTYIGVNSGLDTVSATTTVNGSQIVSNSSNITWTGGTHVTLLGLNLSPTLGSFGQSVTLKASLGDASANPAAPVAGAVITFSLGTQSCAGVTDGSGNASCALTPDVAGSLALTAAFAGSAQYTPATASAGFRVLAALGPTAPGAPIITGAIPGNGQVTVFFTPPINTGGSPITGYNVGCTPVGGGATLTASGAGNPITVTGLTNGVTYTCTVDAVNAVGTGPNATVSVADVVPPAGGCSPGAQPAAVTRGGAEEAGLVTSSLGAIPMVAAILPSSRSVQVGCVATAFATIINAGAVTASGVSIVPPPNLAGSFNYQTTDPQTNALTGSLNTPIDIPPGLSQTYVIALTPAAPFAPGDLAFSFAGANTNPVGTLTGINTLLLSASANPVPDIVALAATAHNDGIVDIPGATGTGVFAVATVNVGTGSMITASADTGGGAPPVGILLCQTNPATGQCMSPLQASVPVQINAGATPTFGIFVTGAAVVPFDPANNRIFVRFKDVGGVTRGSTSVAVRTQ